MDEETKKYVDWIKANLDKKTGKTQLALARHLNLAHPQITRLLQGKRRLKVDEVPKVAEFLGVEPPVSPADSMFQTMIHSFLAAPPHVQRTVLDLLDLLGKQPEASSQEGGPQALPQSRQKQNDIP